jgi:YegS/Rv2252/BmrU family lipid kinase
MSDEQTLLADVQTPAPAEPEAEASLAPSFRKVHIIVNPASGQDRPVLKLLNSAFQPSGIEWRVLVTTGPGDARRFVAEALAENVEVVAVYGGDGTIMEVARGLIGSGIPLAIFPGGTANVMSVELGIPNDLAQACALVCGGQGVMRTIDVGQVGDHIFLTRLSLGLEAQIVENTAREDKDRSGWLAYMLTALRELSNPPLAHYYLTLDGQAVESEGLVCLVANSGILTPNSGIAGQPTLSIAPNVSIHDGMLDVIVVRGSDLGALLAVAASVVAGNENAEPLQHWQAREVTVDADPPQTIQCDGEMIGPTPIQVRVLPQALTILVPKAAQPKSA